MPSVIENIGCGITVGCFPDITLNSCINYHQEHALLAATEPRRLHRNFEVACGATISRLSRDNLCHENFQAVGCINLCIERAAG